MPRRSGPSRRLFATATPRLYGPAAKARAELEGADVEIASMDDEAVFGPVAHRLTFRSAVEQGILVDYELVVVAVTDARWRTSSTAGPSSLAGDLTTDAESLGFLVALRKAITELGLRRSISFHSSVARARAFARWLPLISDETPVPETGHVAGTMPTGERNRIVERLRNPEVPTLVTNARCLTEGIDVPALDAVAFVDPRGSHVDVVQAVGRAMRTAPGKARGRVIIPVFLSAADAADPEAAVESSAFKPVLDVLRALRAHDEELSAEATRLRVELGARPSRLVDSNFLRDHIRVLDVATRHRRLRLRASTRPQNRRSLRSAIRRRSRHAQAVRRTCWRRGGRARPGGGGFSGGGGGGPPGGGGGGGAARPRGGGSRRSPDGPGRRTRTIGAPASSD